MLPQRDWNPGVDLVVIQGAIRDAHTELRTRPLRRGVRSLADTQSAERECEVHCYLWSYQLPVRGKTGLLWLFFPCRDFSSAFYRCCGFSPSPHCSLCMCRENESLKFAGRVKLSLQHGAEGYDYPVR